MKKKKKIALVLSGGGFLGAFQLGALNYIKENWKQITGKATPMKFDIIAGVSVGALNGSLIAMDKFKLLNDLWINQIGRKGVTEIYTSNFIDTSSKSEKLKMKIDLKGLAKKLLPNIDIKLKLGEKLGLIFSKKKRKEIIDEIIKDVQTGIRRRLPQFRSLADNAPLKKKLEKYLDRSTIKGTDFLCGFVSLDTGKYHSVLHSEFASNQDFVKGVLASTSIPIVWNPVDSIQFHSEKGLVNSLNNVDGGIRNVSPLGDVIKLINEDTQESDYKVIVINCSNGLIKPEDFAKKSIGGIATRSIHEIVFAEIFNNDVKHFTKINDLIKQANSRNITLYGSDSEKLNSFDSVIIQPHEDVELGNALVATEKLIYHRITHGKAMARVAFERRINE